MCKPSFDQIRNMAKNLVRMPLKFKTLAETGFKIAAYAVCQVIYVGFLILTLATIN